MAVLIILIDNLHAGEHSNWGTLSPTATVLQLFNHKLFHFHLVTSESQYAQYVRARASLSGSNDFTLHPPRQSELLNLRN